MFGNAPIFAVYSPELPNLEHLLPAAAIRAESATKHSVATFAWSNIAGASLMRPLCQTTVSYVMMKKWAEGEQVREYELLIPIQA